MIGTSIGIGPDVSVCFGWSSGNIIAAVPKNVFCFLLIPSIGYWEHGQETPNFAWEKECSVP